MCALALHSLKRTAVSRRSERKDGDLRHAAIVEEKDFLQRLRLERKRSERSGKTIVLMLLSGADVFGTDGVGSGRERMVEALLSSTRDTDVIGWYKTAAVMAILCTEICEPPAVAVKILYTRVATALHRVLQAERAGSISISVHLFPDPTDNQPGGPAELVFYPEIAQQTAKKPFAIVKRILDITGSVLALVVLAPVFLIIALLIKLTSKGPVLFCQTRVGQYGRRFPFLKFRSMYVDSDCTIHREYMVRYIAGAKDSLHTDARGNGVYKIAQDSRVTPLGRILRKTSMDELPQFINVLRGEMSLVGPRPALPYEIEHYNCWHHRRVLAAKPGITGLWQVKGRSRTSFDDMARLDLQYIENASIALDLKILLQTPRAVFSGDGAY